MMLTAAGVKLRIFKPDIEEITLDFRVENI
jgi:hypothetical protein